MKALVGCRGDLLFFSMCTGFFRDMFGMDIQFEYVTNELFDVVG